MLSESSKVFLQSIKGSSVLHISDTRTDCYPEVERLIKQVRPTLLIHTGDMADEFKVGRKQDHLNGYREAVTRLLSLMKENTQQIWVTHGNNDDVPWLKQDAGISVFPMEGSSHNYCGLRLFLRHQPIGWLDKFAYDFALYGHGYTADVHKPEDNRFGELCYINGMRHTTIIDPCTKRFRHIPYKGENTPI